jgi:flagellar biosynthesis protein FlhB
VAALDYGLERRLFEGSLRMTPLEVREESHRLEGDPQLKERRRRLSLRLMRRLREKRKQWQS